MAGADAALVDHVRAISFDTLPARAVVTAAATILGVVLRIQALAIAIGEPCLQAGIRVGADAVLAEAAATNHTAESAVVGVIQEVGTVASIPTAARRLAGAGIGIERLAR